MQAVSRRCHNLLRPNGLALFVIGNTEYTEYKGVRIDNRGALPTHNGIHAAIGNPAGEALESSSGVHIRRLQLRQPGKPWMTPRFAVAGLIAEKTFEDE
jgi:hypothetical protein